MLKLKLARLGWLRAMRGSDREAYEAARDLYLDAMYEAEDFLFRLDMARLIAVPLAQLLGVRS